MALESEVTRTEHVGNGSLTVFTYQFRIDSEAELQAWVKGTLTALLNVTGVGDDAGGTVEFAIAPANGADIVLRRNPTQTSKAMYQQAGRFPSDAHEQALDDAAKGRQELQEVNNRSVRGPIYDGPMSELGPAAARAGKFLIFDNDGQPVTGAGVVPEDVAVSVFMEDFLVVGDADAARAYIEIMETNRNLARGVTMNRYTCWQRGELFSWPAGVSTFQRTHDGWYGDMNATASPLDWTVEYELNSLGSAVPAVMTLKTVTPDPSPPAALYQYIAQAYTVGEMVHLQWGTGQARGLTFQFLYRSNVDFQLGFELQGGAANDRIYGALVNIIGDDVVRRAVVSIPGDSDLSTWWRVDPRSRWGVIRLNFINGNPGVTPGQWQALGSTGVIGQGNFFAAGGGYFQMSAIDMHEGESRRFIPPSPLDELRRHQRNFCKTFELDVDPLQNQGDKGCLTRVGGAGGRTMMDWEFPAEMLLAPTISTFATVGQSTQMYNRTDGTYSPLTAQHITTRQAALQAFDPTDEGDQMEVHMTAEAEI